MRAPWCLTIIGGAAVLCGASPVLADPVADYLCDDGTTFTATFSPPGDEKGEVKLAYPDGRMVVLPQAISADGGRYVQGDTEFWIKGSGGTLTTDGKATSCEAKS